MQNCPLCNTFGVRAPNPHTRQVEFQCDTCGPFRIGVPSPFDLLFTRFSQSQRMRVANWVFDQNRLGSHPLLTDAVLHDVATTPVPRMQTRLNSYLRVAVELAEFVAGRTFNAYHPRLQVATCCLSDAELEPFIEYWERSGAISTRTGAIGQGHLTADGLLIFEEQNLAAGVSRQAFVAMWFNPEVADAYLHGIASAVTSAGYEPLRIDQVHHEGRIDDRIVAEIRRSKFVVADFTGHRGGVYYEAGFAHGLGLPVIFCCRQDALKDLHFDVRQYNTIDWINPDDLRVRLHNRLLAVFGAGPAAPNAAAIP
jgi:hypothetical protein